MRQNRAIYHLTLCALMAAVLCILGPVAIPVGAVPLSLTNFAISLTVCLLGMKWGTVSVAVYLLLGGLGLPVFSGYAGGVGKLAGPTGGYLVGFLFMALIGGFLAEQFAHAAGWSIMGLALGCAADYAFGTVWFMHQMECPFWYAMTVCVFPFALFDAAKIAGAVLLSGVLRRQLIRAHLME